MVSNPDLVATDMELATLSAMWYWKKNDLNSIADNDKLTSDKANEKITYGINKKKLGEKERFELQQKVIETLKK